MKNFDIVDEKQKNTEKKESIDILDMMGKVLEIYDILNEMKNTQKEEEKELDIEQNDEEIVEEKTEDFEEKVEE